jgi:hypothetical protein
LLRVRAAGVGENGPRVELGKILRGKRDHLGGQPAEFVVGNIEGIHARKNLITQELVATKYRPSTTIIAPSTFTKAFNRQDHRGSAKFAKKGVSGFVPANWTPLIFFASFATVLRDLRG